MSYTKTTWNNDTAPAINATNLNKIEQGIYDNDTNVGDLTSLTTTANTDLVSAVNEVDSHADTNATNIGDLTTLTTTAKNNLVSAINELDSDKLDATGTAVNSTKWNNLINDKATENNTDTWISVLKDDKLQHTTISSIISRGIVSNYNSTTGVTYFTAGNLKIVLATISYKTGTTAPYLAQWNFTSPISFTKAYVFCGESSGNASRTIQVRGNASSFSGTSIGGIVIVDIASYENDFPLMLIGI